MTFIISSTTRTSIVSSAMLDCSITSLCHVAKFTGATFFCDPRKLGASAPVGAGVALRSAPQLWRKSLERSLMQRASGIRQKYSIAGGDIKTKNLKEATTHRLHVRRQADCGLLLDDWTLCTGTLLHPRWQCYEFWVSQYWRQQPVYCSSAVDPSSICNQAVAVRQLCTAVPWYYQELVDFQTEAVTWTVMVVNLHITYTITSDY